MACARRCCKLLLSVTSASGIAAKTFPTENSWSTQPWICSRSPKEKVDEFIEVFLETLKGAKLLEDLAGGKTRVLDATLPAEVGRGVGEEQIKKLSKGVTVQATDSCFVMMPFVEPLGGYYTTVYQPAIDKAKLKAVRADAEIFGTREIIDQIWGGIHCASAGR
jgi:hypothetical protein